jgi:hypothetical protein
VKAKGIRNIVNKIITEIFPNLEKVLPIQVWEVSRTSDRLDQSRTSPWHFIIKNTGMENTERMLKAIREKKQITYKGKQQNNSRFLNRTLKARRA